MWKTPFDSVSFRNESPALCPAVSRSKTPFPVTTQMLPLVSAAGPPPLYQIAAATLLLDNGCAGDPDLHRDQIIARPRHGGNVRTQKIPFPDRRRRLAVRIECINTVVLGRGVNDVLV